MDGTFTVACNVVEPDTTPYKVLWMILGKAIKTDTEDIEAGLIHESTVSKRSGRSLRNVVELPHRPNAGGCYLVYQ